MPGFDVDPEEITHFCRLSFENQLVGQTRDKVVPELERLGGADGLLSKLQTDVSAGIGGDDDEIARRKAHFGSNYVEPEPPESIFAMAWTALQDPCLIFLCFAAMVSFLVGIMFDQGLEWLEGVAILCAVFVVVTVSAVNDYQKEQQFRELSVVNDNILVTVVRDGVKAKISTHDIVVGDVVLLSTGDQVCADGVIFKDNDLGLTESMLTGESVVKRKGAFKLEESDNPEAPVKIQPTLFAGTLVQEGEGAMIVVAVGKHTYQGNMEEKMKEDEDERSVLQQKLDKMTVLITKAGAVAGVATVLVLFARVGVAFLQAACCREEFDFAVHFLEMLRFLVVGVTVFVVAVPEGLPLAVTIALAFSVKKMMKDQNLVRHLSACETMGSATTICSDKTGTLTTGKMSVVRATFALDAASAPLLSDVNSSASEIPSALQDILAQALVINTSAKSDISWERSTGQATRHQGNDTECAMLALANRLLTAQGAGGDCPYKSVRDEHPGDEPGRRCISFSSDRKRMSTLVPIKGGGGARRVYTKGASEVVLELCSRIAQPGGEATAMDAGARARFDEAIGKMADEGLRTLTVAYREIAAGEEEPKDLEEDLILLAVLGLEDPVRPEVPGAIRACKEAGIVVRMVTGDNARTAAAIAKKCGILGDEIEEGQVMTGAQFRERVVRPDDEINMEEFDKIWMDLRVLARSSPLDKLTLVTGIQQSKISKPQTVAVTGDGTNDAPALKRADVGFAMGKAGTQVAKNAADIIVLDDNFASIVQAVKWGRCVYDNICKFLQFQLTVNLTACAIAVLGASVLTKSPLTVIQLLWVNMIMDSFASLALATEDPRPDVLKRRPYPRNQPLLSAMMLRSLVCHSMWQIFILFFLIFAVGDVCESSAPGSHHCTVARHDALGDLKSGRPTSFDQDVFVEEDFCVPFFNPKDNSTFALSEDGTMLPLRSEEYCREGAEQDGMPTQHYTLVFTAFVMLQLFNQINARKIHGEANVFSGILDNKLFLSIMAMEFFMQVLMVNTPGFNTAMGCTPLTFSQWVGCFFIGLTELPLNLVIRRVPLRWFPGESAEQALLETDEDRETGGGFGKKRRSDNDGVPLLVMGSKAI